MTPRIFLESGPLWAVGLAVARRCVLRLGFDVIYPNLYYLWVAPTTYYHKSTGLNAITDMVRDTMPPDEFALHDLDEPVKHPAISATMDQAVFDLFNAYYAALHNIPIPAATLMIGCAVTMDASRRWRSS